MTVFKRNFRIVLFSLLLAEALPLTLSANPGDTTWVTIYNLRKFTSHGDFDTVAYLPAAKQYRKIRMHYIIGRYGCPSNEQYCGQWDYTTQIFARPKRMDTVEIARVITPYAGDWLSQNKKHDYVIDVTDYATILHDTLAMRFRYDGWSWGFTITLKLEFIEGVPPMDIAAVRRIYQGYFQYGNNSSPIENKLVPTAFTFTQSTFRAYIKNVVSGHGSDNTAGCAEFCNRYYDLKIDNQQHSQRQLWRSDCGYNHVYPQTGTWVFNRGNWCPGAVVDPIYHDIGSATIPNTQFTVDVDMQPYTSSGNYGGYIWESQFLVYNPDNHMRDVSIEDILAPTKNENWFRFNGACMNPMIRIKNTGSDSVKSVSFEYGIRGRTMSTYTWTGSLGFLQTTDIVFPPSEALMSQTVSLPFDVKIVSVNEAGADENKYNDIYTSATATVATLPAQFIVKTVTNGSPIGITQDSENSWKLTDAAGNIVAQRNNMKINSSYRDSIYGLQPGCYKFELFDEGCDGFDWWFFSNYNPNPGSGIMRLGPPAINSTFYSFPGDIGCGFTKYFYVGSRPALPPPPAPIDDTGINYSDLSNNIRIYPNPASDAAVLQFDLPSTQTVSYVIRDITGRAIAIKHLGKIDLRVEIVSTKDLTNGIYFVDIQLENGTHSSRKIVVAH